MISSTKLYNKINDYYLSKKSAKYSYDSFVKETLYTNEKYLEIENTIRKLKFQISKANYENNRELYNSLKNNLKILENEEKALRESILKNVKYFYDCNICNDTGIYKGKKCKCYYNLITKFTLESLNITERKFPSFKNEYPEELEKHYSTLKLFSEKFPDTKVKNFVFLGKVGTGKTYLSKCVASYLKSKNFLPVFLTANELNSIFLKMHRQEIDRELIFDILTTSDFLIIDDLGTEPLYNNVTAEYLLSVISERIDKNKHFIITTNLSTLEILERYNERFLSRISNKEHTIMMPFNGKDLRK